MDGMEFSVIDKARHRTRRIERAGAGGPPRASDARLLQCYARSLVIPSAAIFPLI
jgi:hypothetical protein